MDSTDIFVSIDFILMRATRATKRLTKTFTRIPSSMKNGMPPRSEMERRRIAFSIMRSPRIFEKSLR